MMMKNRTFLITTLWIAVPILVSCESNKGAKRDGAIDVNRPNIVYILADDLGYGDVSAYNPGSKIPTPHIDRLAGEGMRFTDAHSPSSVCTPTRYGILTGRYCWRSKLPQGVLQGYGRALIEKDRETVASLLKKHNYVTGVVGKWHLGLDWVLKPEYEQAIEDGLTDTNDLGMVRTMKSAFIDFRSKPTDGPLDHGFDYSFILPASLDMEPYCYLENDELTELPTEQTEGNDLNTGYTGAFWRPGLIAPSFDFYQVLPTFTDKAIQFIENQRHDARPFFLYLALAAPHTPWVPGDSYFGTAEAGSYGDFVHMVDAHIGRVLESLESTGLKDNTLVIFTSDNGPYWRPPMIERYHHRAAHYLRGMKGDIWEGGHRVPFIARWPGRIPKGAKCETTTALTNFMATAAEIVGAEADAVIGEDSYSILPNLIGESTEPSGQQAVIHHSSRAVFAIRKGQWKLVQGRGSGGFSPPARYEPKPGEPTGQLYDLENDISEQRNLFDENPEVVGELTELLESIRK
jgi:arylsulfatase A-like enzyme